MTTPKILVICYPVADSLLQATTTFAVAAREVGLEAVINLSQLPARAETTSPASRQHWLGERVLDWANSADHKRFPCKKWRPFSARFCIKW